MCWKKKLIKPGPATSTFVISSSVKKLAFGFSAGAVPLLQRLKARKHVDYIALSPIAAKTIDNPDENIPISGSASSSLFHDMTLTVDQTNSSFTQSFSSDL